MDKMLHRYMLPVCMALAMCCSAPQLVCALESVTPTVQAGSAQKTPQPQHAENKIKNSSKASRLESRQKEKRAKGLHAPAWAFGGKEKSRDAWRTGANTRDLQKRAVCDNSSDETVLDPTDCTNSTLDDAQEKNANKSGMGLSVGQDDSSWRKKGQYELEAGEDLPMQSRHVLRAYADVDAGDDLSIRVGPELILKDEQRERTPTNAQPESALGLGMQFKLDF